MAAANSYYGPTDMPDPCCGRGREESKNIALTGQGRNRPRAFRGGPATVRSWGLPQRTLPPSDPVPMPSASPEPVRADLRPRAAAAVGPGRTSGQPRKAGADAAPASPEAEEARLRGELALETGALLGDSGLLPYQVHIVRQAIERITDPSAELLRQQLGTWNDDEEDIAAAISSASDEQLVGEWTSVRSLPAEGSASLRDMYEIWRAARARLSLIHISEPTRPY